MRLSAYKKCISSAMTLPETVEGLNYFNGKYYNPRQEAIRFIESTARLDIDRLYNREYVHLLEYIDQYGKVSKNRAGLQE